MTRLLGTLYLIIIISFSIVIKDISPHEYPRMLEISELFIGLLSCIAMFLYIIERKPNFLTWIWKIVPIALVADFVTEIIYSCIIRGNDSPQFIVFLIVLDLLILYPLFYCTFRYGYSFDFDEKNLRSNRKN